MRRRATVGSLILVLLALLGVAASSAAHAADIVDPPQLCHAAQPLTTTVHRAALVVTFGDGMPTKTFCIAFTGDTISGIQLLQYSGLQLVTSGGGLGTAVCGIGGVGSKDGSTYTACFDTRPNSWAYYQYRSGAWHSYAVGAGSSVVSDGSIEGWAWGQSARPDPPGDICPTPTAVPVDTPTAVSTPTPAASATAAVASSTAAAPATRTATSTAAVPSVTAAGSDPESTPSAPLTDALSPEAPTHVVNADGASTGTPESAVDAAARTPVVASATARATPTPPSGVVVIDAAQAKENASHAESVTRTDGGGRRSLFLFAGLAVAVIAVGAFVVYRRRQLG